MTNKISKKGLKKILEKLEQNPDLNLFELLKDCPHLGELVQNIEEIIW